MASPARSWIAIFSGAGAQPATRFALAAPLESPLRLSGSGREGVKNPSSWLQPCMHRKDRQLSASDCRLIYVGENSSTAYTCMQHALGMKADEFFGVQAISRVNILRPAGDPEAALDASTDSTGCGTAQSAWLPRRSRKDCVLLSTDCVIGKALLYCGS
jgi:hypothetical protein